MKATRGEKRTSFTCEALGESLDCSTAIPEAWKEDGISPGRLLERYQTSPAGKRCAKHGITAVLHYRPGGKARNNR